jgi:predicted transcriptional regulator
LTLGEISKVIDCTFVTGEKDLDLEITKVLAADLMSDVLAYTDPGAILITGLRNVQSVITSHVAEVKAIVYVRGKMPDDEAINLAEQKGIPLLSSRLSMYEACGRLFEKGLRSGSNMEAQ